MALAIDSEMPSNAGYGPDVAPGDVPNTWTVPSFNNVAGTVLYLFIGMGNTSGTTAPTFDSCTYNGVTMTKLAEQTTSGSTGGGRLALYRLLSPATGSHDFVLSYSGGAVISSTRNWAGAISLTGNHATTPEAQSAVTAFNASSTQASATLSGCTAGNITLACAGLGLTPTTFNQTNSFLIAINENTTMNNGLATRAASSGTVTHTMDQGSTDHWVTIIVEVAAAGAGAPTATEDSMTKRVLFTGFRGP